MSLNSKLNMQKQLKGKKSLNNTKGEEQTLKAQASKIQNKLQSLKAQITMRKTMKNKQKLVQEGSFKSTQRNVTGQSWSTSSNMTTSNMKSVSNQSNSQLNKFLLGSSRQKFSNIQQNSNQSQNPTKLQTLFLELKMQQFKDIIKEKYNIDSLDKLLQLTEDDIDTWKAIPVGFRIKIRKFINQHKRYRQQNKSMQQRNQKQSQNQNNSEDIQQIISRRKNQRVYEPIINKYVEQQQDEQFITQYDQPKQKKSRQKIEEEKQKIRYQRDQKYVSEDQEDILISSLNSAFMQRRGIIKKEGSSNDIESPNRQNSKSRNKVHWDANVKEYNKQQSNFKGEVLMTKYPTQKSTIKISQIKSGSSYKGNQAHYCWTCLKKISKLQIDEEEEQNPTKNNKIFCSIKCKENYNNLIQTSHIQLQLENRINGEQQQKYQTDDGIVDLDLV